MTLYFCFFFFVLIVVNNFAISMMRRPNCSCWSSRMIFSPHMAALCLRIRDLIARIVCCYTFYLHSELYGVPNTSSIKQIVSVHICGLKFVILCVLRIQKWHLHHAILNWSDHVGAEMLKPLLCHRMETPEANKIIQKIELGGVLYKSYY